MFEFRFKLTSFTRITSNIRILSIEYWVANRSMHTQSNKTRIKCASCNSLFLFSSVDLKTHNLLQLVRFGCSVWHCVLQWKNALTVLLPHTIMCKSLVHRQSATTTKYEHQQQHSNRQWQHSQHKPNVREIHFHVHKPFCLSFSLSLYLYLTLSLSSHTVRKRTKAAHYIEMSEWMSSIVIRYVN